MSTTVTREPQLSPKEMVLLIDLHVSTDGELTAEGRIKTSYALQRKGYATVAHSYGIRIVQITESGERRATSELAEAHNRIESERR